MDSAFAKKLLDVLIDNALRILGAGFGVNWAESTFFDIVRLLQRESNLRGYFLERASASGKSGSSTRTISAAATKWVGMDTIGS